MQTIEQLLVDNVLTLRENKWREVQILFRFGKGDLEKMGTGNFNGHAEQIYHGGEVFPSQKIERRKKRKNKLKYLRC